MWPPLAGGQSQSQHLIQYPKTNRDSPLVINNFVKFDSDWAKTVSRLQSFKARVLKMTLTFDPVTQNQ